MKSTLTVDEKWDMVQKHYESAYHVRFKERIADSKIEELYRELLRLRISEQKHSERQIVQRHLYLAKPEETSVPV